MRPQEVYTEFTRRIIGTNFDIDGGHLLIEGVPVVDIAEKCGTPFYIYSRRVMDARLDDLRRTYPDVFRIHYSVKANPNPIILRHFVSRDCGLEIASGGEFDRAIEAGCAAGNIIFAGPGKTPAEIEKVIAAGIGELHIESLLEARRAGDIAARLNRKVSAAIRVNPAAEASVGAMRMGGKPAPFGVDEEQLDPVLDFVTQHPYLEFTGIHIFTGTQILDADSLLSYYQKGVQIGQQAAKRCHLPLHTLDFGGGLGIPYYPGDESLDLHVLQSGMARLISEISRVPEFSKTRFVIEPGRFLVGESGIYVARVNDVKTSKGKRFAILDGGMNHHLAASGNLGQTIKRDFPIAVLDKCSTKIFEPIDIVGPLCTPLDTLGRQVQLPPIEVGDLVGIFQSGAYGRSASPLDFLSHPAPKEVFVDGGTFRLSHRERKQEEAGIC